MSVGFELRKDPSGYYLKWRVVDTKTGQMVLRFSTKRQANLLIGILHGDHSVIPRFYRLTIEGARRKYSHRQESDAWATAALQAAVLGLTPAACRADPETGEPLPGED